MTRVILPLPNLSERKKDLTIKYIQLRLVQYLFLDLAQILDPQLWSDLVDNLIKFPSAFSLPPSIIKLTQVYFFIFF